MKSVYCAVRTGSLNIAVCASSLNGLISRENSSQEILQTKKPNILIRLFNNVVSNTVNSDVKRPSFSYTDA